MKTNVGKEFLGLIDKCFPAGHPLRKVMNRNNVKVSYSTMPNMGQIIAGKNKKILSKTKENEKICSCPKTKVCPLENKCLSKGIVYQATVNLKNKKTKNKKQNHTLAKPPLISKQDYQLTSIHSKTQIKIKPHSANTSGSIKIMKMSQL